MAGNLTIGALLAQGTARLRENGFAVDNSHGLDAELLLAHTLSVTRTHLKTHPEAAIEPNTAARYAKLLERRASGEPIAYIVGYRDFWTLRLAVSPAVLVPRPETELLVERALALGPEGPADVVDLGTGSGAIALAIASERPAWSLTATDISDAALTAARSNASRLGLTRVEFVQGEWFGPLSGRQFDLVISNPPYVAATDPALQDPALKREPQIALTPGHSAANEDENGLSCLRAIIHSAPRYLKRRGWLLLEHGADQAEAVVRELVDRGFTHVRSHPDLAGHLRMTEAELQ
jgi:release factor glutamine methyltransferase